MTKRKTKKEFVVDARKVHENLYSYKKVCYNNNHDKVPIFCKFHKKYFMQSPNTHLVGHGCPNCARLNNLERIRNKHEKLFFLKSKRIHGTKYRYDRVIYTNNHTKVDIFCKIHKEYFRQTPDSHLSGKGCQKCANMIINLNSNNKARKNFVKKAENIHGKKYGYQKVNYINCKTTVEIFCNFHKKYFKQEPRYHLQDVGCPDCGHLAQSHQSIGFHSKQLNQNERKEICFFYYLRLNFPGKKFYKIGISKNLNSRIKLIEKKSGAKVEILYQFKGKRYNIARYEEKLKKKLNHLRMRPPVKFDGHTECFRKNIIKLV